MIMLARQQVIVFHFRNTLCVISRDTNDRSSRGSKKID